MLKNYERLPNGVVRQVLINKKKEYNVEYVNVRYNTYGDLGPKMAFLRLGFLLGALKGVIPNSVLDIGYGNGDFLKAAANIIPECYGSDISNYPVPEGCKFREDIYKDKYDVVCFFDVLEHFDDIYDIANLQTKYILISVPNCHYPSDEWFEQWKHRRPDEHLWHFNTEGLINFFDEVGYDFVAESNFEDTIRKPTTEFSNILTCLFKKR